MTITVMRQIRKTVINIEELKPGDLFEIAEPSGDTVDFGEVHLVIVDPSSKVTQLSVNLTTGRTVRLHGESRVYPVVGTLEWKYRDED